MTATGASQSRVANRTLLLDDVRTRRPVPRSYPSIVRFETHASCRLRCSHCFVARRPAAAQETMALDLFMGLAEEIFPRIDVVEFGHSGEPLQDPWLVRRLEAFTADGPKIDLMTSGDGLRELLPELLPHLRTLTISLESTDPDVYDMVRRGSSFRTLLGALRTFAGYRRAMPEAARPELRFRVTLFGGNHGWLPQMISRLAEEGAQRVDLVNGVVVDASMDDQDLKGWETDLSVALQRAVLQGHLSGIAVRYPVVPPKAPYLGVPSGQWRADAELPRHAPWTRATVDVSGHISLCCPARLLSGAVSEPLGASGFFGTWTGPTLARFRQQGTRGGACGPCPIAE